MKSNFDACFAAVLVHEGGYVNDPRDPGGRTNLGVTQRAWEAWVGHEVNEDFMRKLTPDGVKPFYKSQYWDKIKGDELPSGVDEAVFDYSVNSGTGRAAKALQQAVGVLVDGAIGPGTLAAVAKVDHADLVMKICSLREAFLKSLPTFDHFGKGWMIRVAQVEAKATSMAKQEA
jgi:lysozyme family protein